MARPSKYRRKKHEVSSGSAQDNFSKLPDDIISGHILPYLDVQERMCTCVLSSRWRNLWRCSLGSNLVFPHGLEKSPFFSSVMRFNSSLVLRNRRSYIEKVDFILKSFTGPKLDHFGVCFDLDSRFSGVVNRWLEFAIRWEVKRMNLNLGPFQKRSLDTNYKLPCLEKLSTFPSLGTDALPCINGGAGGICFLKELSLKHVSIDGETVKYLLSCCPFLELMSLQASVCSNLKIVGQPCKLKHLEILGCLVPQKVEISAPYLTTLKYDGSKEDLLLDDVPLVASLHMLGTYFKHFLNEFFQLHLQHFSCLSAEDVGISHAFLVERSISFPLEFPKLVKLEELKVTMDTSYDLIMLWPGVLIKAAPRLRRFVIKEDFYASDAWKKWATDERYREQREKLRAATKFKHSCLKVLEVAGFVGRMHDCEFVDCLLSVATSLEQFVLKYKKGYYIWEDRKREAGRRKSALRSIESRLPSNAQLVVL